MDEGSLHAHAPSERDSHQQNDNEASHLAVFERRRHPWSNCAGCLVQCCASHIYIYAKKEKKKEKGQ